MEIPLKISKNCRKEESGFALHQVQQGVKPNNSKPLKGFSPGVLEIVIGYNTDTYRTVYTVKISDTVYVLHCFQKKSKKGIATPKYNIDLIKNRLKEAKQISKEISGN